MTTGSRRRFLAALGWVAAGRTAWARPAGGLARLPAPDLSDERVVRFVAGIRPFRRSGPRVERQAYRGKIIVHNYGHGGALLDHSNGYVVPRSDALVVGGTFEVGVGDARADPAACARILADNRAFFGTA